MASGIILTLHLMGGGVGPLFEDVGRCDIRHGDE